MWSLRNLIDSSRSNKAEINGKWVPARPISSGVRSRLKDALDVLRGKADAFKWPEGQ